MSNPSPVSGNSAAQSGTLQQPGVRCGELDPLLVCWLSTPDLENGNAFIRWRPSWPGPPGCEFRILPMFPSGNYSELIKTFTPNCGFYKTVRCPNELFLWKLPVSPQWILLWSTEQIEAITDNLPSVLFVLWTIITVFLMHFSFLEQLCNYLYEMCWLTGWLPENNVTFL